MATRTDIEQSLLESIQLTPVGFGTPNGKWQSDGDSAQYYVNVGEKQPVYAYCNSKNGRNWRIGHLHDESEGVDRAKPTQTTQGLYEAVVAGPLINVGDGARMGRSDMLTVVEVYEGL